MGQKLKNTLAVILKNFYFSYLKMWKHEIPFSSKNFERKRGESYGKEESSCKKKTSG
jgi:hypothetical protein